MRLFGQTVAMCIEVQSGTRQVALHEGQRGRVVWEEWDEPKSNLIVEFDEEVTVANDGLLLNPREAWVSRSQLREAVVQDQHGST